MKIIKNMSLLFLLLGTVAAPAYAQEQQTTPTKPQQSRAQQLMGATAPKLADLTDAVLYGDVWERPQLSKRDRSLITSQRSSRSIAPTSFVRTSLWRAGME